MKKRLLNILCVVALTGFCIFNFGETDEINYKETRASEDIQAVEKLAVHVNYNSTQYWEVNDLSDTLISSEEALQDLAQRYVDDLEVVLDMPQWWKQYNENAKVYELYVSIARTEQSKTRTKAQKLTEDSITGGIMLSANIAKDQWQCRDAALAHELTHSMGFMDNFSSSLDEGFCDYAQERVGAAYFDEEYTLDEFVVLIMQTYQEMDPELFEEVVNHIGEGRMGYPYASGSEKFVWYRLSHSFVEYLVNRFGFDKAKKLCLEGTDESSYQEILGEDFESIKADWYEGLKNKEAKHTYYQFTEHLVGGYPSQYIVVRADGNKATLTMYEKLEDSTYDEIFSTNADIGENGIGKTKEGDRKTPEGEFSFQFAFGIKDNPGTSFEYTKVDDTYYWVDDSNSVYYNKFVSTNDVDKDWSSAEHIVDAQGTYNYVLALNYNEECKKGLGSAIFLHCKPTSGAGCIAIDEETMVKILQTINTDCKIVIQ